jgi:glutamate dehydrogenase
MTDEEGASLGQVIVAFLVAERLLDLDKLWEQIERRSSGECPDRAVRDRDGKRPRASFRHLARHRRGRERERLVQAARARRAKDRRCSDQADPGGSSQRGSRTPRSSSRARSAEEIVHGLVRLYEIDGIFGIAALAAGKKLDELGLTRAYTRLGEALGLDWAQQQLARFTPRDQWERLLTAGLARDFEQLRIDFLSKVRDKDPVAAVEAWVADQKARIDQFRKLIDRARREGSVSASMLAQIASQARILLAR